MEIESEDGAAIPIERESSAEIGRRLGLGFRCPSSSDRTVSRRHLSLRLAGDSGGELSILFEVIGRNPILVCGGGGGGRTRVYRNSEKGELRAGERFSLSLKSPAFWVLKRREGGEGAVEQRVLDAVERREKRTMERKEKERKAKLEASGGEKDEEVVDGELELELAALDVSRIDPVKEFGFLVKGHEFDHYPRHKIRSAAEWNWFLEERRGNSDDDDEPTDEGSSLKRNRRGKKNKKGGDYVDEEWTGESGDEKEIGVGNAERSKYSTRLKDPKRLRKDDLASTEKSVKGKDLKHRKDEVDEEEEETLGGFIVNDNDDGGEGEELEEEEEEKEFDEDEDDDD